MRKNSLVYIVKSYTMAGIALTAIALLMMTSYSIIDIASAWIITLLWTAVIISILVMTNQIMRTNRKLRNYEGQLAANKDRLTNEIKHRLWAEKTASENKIRLQFVDENFPVMLAYFNLDQRCRYHNQLFRKWFMLKENQIDGRLLQEFSDAAFYLNIQECIKKTLSGKIVHNERILKSSKGLTYSFTEQFIPHFDSKREIIGFYTLHIPRAQEKKLPPPNNQLVTNTPDSIKPTTQKNADENKIRARAPDNEDSQSGVSADRIIQAIEGGEFHLYCQKITPLQNDPDAPIHQEILIRMAEEENNLIPPGAFLPFVEKYKMMPLLDRWVVSYMIQWLSTYQSTSKSIFCINVAQDTLSDASFSEFMRNQLQKTRIPAQTLCFEIEELDAIANPANALSFAENIRSLGCLVSLCSFNHNQASLDILRKIKIDFLKIDGSLICNILQDPEDLAKVIAINRIAHIIKIQTIAELVETNEIIVKLREIGVDFAQGFGISRPHPLKELQ